MVCACSPENTVNVSAKATIRNTRAIAQVLYVYKTADGELCFDLLDLMSVDGVTDIYSSNIYRRNFLLVVCNYTGYPNLQK